jgi:hypothetical protein
MMRRGQVVATMVQNIRRMAKSLVILGSLMLVATVLYIKWPDQIPFDVSIASMMLLHLEFLIEARRVSRPCATPTAMNVNPRLLSCSSQR